jgi:hypothetical protein
MFDITNYTIALQANTNKIIDLANTIPNTLLHTKPSGAWSMLEILEHLHILDKIVLLHFLKMNDSRHSEETVLGEKKLHTIIVELRSRKKVVAPDFTEPKGVYTSIEEWQTAFTTTRKKIVDFIVAEKIIIDNRQFAHPYLGNLTMVDWCYFIISHADRHCLQLQERLVQE